MSIAKRILIITAIAAALCASMLAAPSQNNFGYTPDPEGAARYAESLPHPSFAAAAPDAMDRYAEEDTFLWRAMDAAHRARYGTPFRVSRQRIGSCVAHGAAHAVYCSEAIEWALGNREEPPLLVNQAAIYGGSRVEARGKNTAGYSDGSTGYHAAKWLREWGVIYKQPYGSADCTESTPEMEKDWGNYGCGGRDDNGRLDAEAKLVPCQHVVKVSNWEELCAAITSGHPVTVASSQGFTTTLDKDSFARASGTWMHQMCIVGLRFGDRPGAAIMNSWGSYLKYTNNTRYPEDLPDGVFWADRSTVERMLARGDSWAISEVKFAYRDINHHDWMETQ